MGVFCCHGNQTKRQTGRLLPVFNCPLPFIICTKLESYCFGAFGGEVINFLKFFFKFDVAMETKKMATGSEMHKLGRQSSNDQNCK